LVSSISSADAAFFFFKADYGMASAFAWATADGSHLTFFGLMVSLHFSF